MEIPTKYITPPENCTGCALCANVCSKNAIRMVWSKDGFLVPTVDTQACVNCGLCVKMCPAQPGVMANEKYSDNLETVVAYGGWNADSETHANSSSGGVFSTLAEKVFSTGGCVFGVIWKDKETAAFSKAENMEQIVPMRGSKYTQAMPGGVYREVKAELQKGRQVLFTGTACQVHALKKYLRKPYDNLLTFDIVCHGVPSRKLLQAYVKHYEDKAKKEIQQVNFRVKKGDWLRYQVQKQYKDGTTLEDVSGNDLFMHLFIGDKMLNKCCYNCPHAHLPRPGDMTLGDYWGVQNLHPDWPIKEGIGSLIANTDKGKTILESLAAEAKITLHKEPFANLFKGQARSYLRGDYHEIPKDRDAALVALSSSLLLDVHREFYNKLQIGPFSLQRGSVLHKLILFPRRVISFAYRTTKQLFKH